MVGTVNSTYPAIFIGVCPADFRRLLTLSVGENLRGHRPEPIAHISTRNTQYLAPIHNLLSSVLGPRGVFISTNWGAIGAPRPFTQEYYELSAGELWQWMEATQRETVIIFLGWSARASDCTPICGIMKTLLAAQVTRRVKL